MGGTSLMRRRDFIISSLAFGFAAGCAVGESPVRRGKAVKWNGPKSLSADVVVYGFTPAGVAAAFSAAQEGASVALIGGWRDYHLGGMMAGGLGTTDFIDFRAYGSFPRKVLLCLNGLSPGADPSNVAAFDPAHVPGYFSKLLEAANVAVVRSGGAAHFERKDRRLVRLVTVDGLIAAGRVFVDGSYEGDLLPHAGVDYAVGRGAATRDNPLDGFRGPPKPNALPPVSPFVVEDDPGSGLLPGVVLGDRTIGSPDRGIPAFNFRLVMTKKPGLRRDFPAAPPPGYRKDRYEPHFRYIDALARSGKRYGSDWSFEKDFIKADLIGDETYDVNNRGAFSTDAVGLNHSYPEASYQERERIWKEHELYVRGWFHALGWERDVRVPPAFAREVRQWGLSKTHFNDPHPNDAPGWPYQLYVREARRLDNGVNWSGRDLEMPDHARGRSDRIVAHASYSQDSHAVNRIAFRREGGDWDLRNEGGFYREAGGADFRAPLPYDIMVPNEDQCTNLIVSFAVATSHQAFSSVRMEPCSMALGEAAGAAAALAAANPKPSVGRQAFAPLQRILLARGVVLDERSALSVSLLKMRTAVKDFVK